MIILFLYLFLRINKKEFVDMKRKMIMLSVALFASICSAKSPEQAGKEKTGVCSSCHGSVGISVAPIYPNLAGQQRIYLEMTLKAYRNKSRSGLQAEAMYAIAAQLTDEDIKHLAAYYSSLKR
jgi:cytochrome c553